MSAIVFSRYQKSIIAMLAFLQFTVVLDFMILSPLGAVLMTELNINPAQFGVVVSAYAFAAGIAGFLAAGFADRFDRKKFLLFFYVGFIAGTLMCGIAWSYETLLAARVVAGLFGGVIGGTSMAIVADLFPFGVRGRVMGTLGTSFAAAQVLGIPAGLALSTWWGWHAPFILIVVVGTGVGVAIAVAMQPVVGHLLPKDDVTATAAGSGAVAVPGGVAPAKAGASAYAHLLAALTKPAHLRGFAATVLLATGGFMMMPYGSAFIVENLDISVDRLPAIYVASGVAAFFAGPLVGRLADQLGKYRVFVVASLLTVAVVVWYTHLDGPTPIWVVIAASIVMFAGVTGRMVTSQALVSTVAQPAERGAFMAINSALQQVSGGIAAVVGGMLIAQRADGGLEHFDRIGFAVAAAALITLVPMGVIAKAATSTTPAPPAPGH